ncbi:hypothetical protein [Phenylobacterium sp.]|uniref:hypothetical protein n=1 Tax=Phenylobacterium sp. TaxID=1871053 RepID=UPI002FCB8AF6
MAVQFSDQFLDELFAPGISTFRKAEIPDLADVSPEVEHWLSNHFLNSLFDTRFESHSKQAAMTHLFRTQNAIRAFQSAREKALGCVSNYKSGRPDTQNYLAAVAAWEVTLLNTQILIDLRENMFDRKGARTDAECRIWEASNRLKHYGEDIRRGLNEAHWTLPLWLTGQGLKTRTGNVSYEELAGCLRVFAKMADMLQNPASFSFGQPKPG